MMYTKEPWNLVTWNLKSCNWIVYMYASELHTTQAFVDQLDLPFFVIQGLDFEPWSPVLAIDSYLYIFRLQIFFLLTWNVMMAGGRLWIVKGGGYGCPSVWGEGNIWVCWRPGPRGPLLSWPNPSSCSFLNFMALTDANI
jgi:hypothetical protein